MAFGEPRAGETVWWLRWLRPGWRHVYALRYEPSVRRWLVVEQSWWRLEVRLAMPEEIAWRLGTATAVLAATAEASHPLRWSGLSCVASIKQLLGIAGRAFTPWQLHQALVRRGARSFP